MVFLKSTVLPCESVSLPSSRIWRSILNTSGWAFSISSKSTTEYGFLLTFSVSWPPSSKPTYPGGEPISFDTVCFSIYSLISRRSIAFSSPNIASARALQSSVLPTPVGPRKINEPTGLFGSLRPTLPRLIAFAIAVTASLWPITLSWRTFSMLRSLSLSSLVSWTTGIPVHSETIFAISSAVTSPLLPFCCSCHFFFASSSFVWSSFCSSRSLAALSKSCSLIALAFSFS